MSSRPPPHAPPGSRSPDPNLAELSTFLGGLSLARTALYAAHAQALDPSAFCADNDEPYAPDPNALYKLSSAVVCHSVLWASDAAVNAGLGEWTHGEVHAIFEDGSMDILHTTLGPGGSRLERVYNLSRLRMLPAQGATIMPAFAPPDGPHQVGAPSASQALSPSPDALSPDDPTRLTAALDTYAKQEDPADRATRSTGTRVLLQISDPARHDLLCTVLAGDRLDPPCVDGHGFRVPRPLLQRQPYTGEDLTHPLCLASSFR